MTPNSAHAVLSLSTSVLEIWPKKCAFVECLGLRVRGPCMSGPSLVAYVGAGS